MQAPVCSHLAVTKLSAGVFACKHGRGLGTGDVGVRLCVVCGRSEGVCVHVGAVGVWGL